MLPPLDASRQQTRLLKLGKSLDKLELHVFDTDKLPPYNALSYTWGPEVPVDTVYVNGESTTIRKNLSDFLLEALKPNHALYWMWIDQLCIDQDSVTERNHQVRQMARIYSEAADVIVWLGQYKQTQELFESIGSFGESLLGGERGSKFDEQILLSPSNNIMSSIVYDNPYWTRLWVVQEFVLAKTLTILCDAAQIDGELFVTVFTSEAAYSSGPASLYYLTSQRSHRGMQKRSLYDTLDHHSHKNCADPRDKVFAIKSIIDNPDKINIDYSKDVQQIWVDTTASLLIEGGRCLGSILSCACILGQEMELFRTSINPDQLWSDLPDSSAITSFNIRHMHTNTKNLAEQHTQLCEELHYLLDTEWNTYKKKFHSSETEHQTG